MMGKRCSGSDYAEFVAFAEQGRGEVLLLVTVVRSRLPINRGLRGLIMDYNPG